MSKLPERLRELMHEKGWNQSDLGKHADVQHTNISDFLSETHVPSYGNLVKLLYTLNCSADYLMGTEDIHTEETLFPVLPFSQRLRDMLQTNGISQERLKRELPVSGSVLYKWLSGKSLPTAESLLRLAEYFGCSIDFLLGRRR